VQHFRDPPPSLTPVKTNLVSIGFSALDIAV
jgi:hypothetical protein